MPLYSSKPQHSRLAEIVLFEDFFQEIPIWRRKAVIKGFFFQRMGMIIGRGGRDRDTPPSSLRAAHQEERRNLLMQMWCGGDVCWCHLNVFRHSNIRRDCVTQTISSHLTLHHLQDANNVVEGVKYLTLGVKCSSL